MSNEYYTHGSYPATGAPGQSAALRAELDAITAGFALLPTLATNAGKAVVINGSSTGLTVTAGTLALAGNLATTGAFNTTIAQTASITVTLPGSSTTLPIASQVLTFTGPTAPRTITLPDAATTVLQSSYAHVIAGPTAARTITLPDANLTIAGPTSGRTYTLPDANLTIPAVTAKGDSWHASASGVMAKVAVGTNGQIPIADSSQTAGINYTDYARAPLNINPNWLFDQINEGAAYSVSGATVQGPDGWSGKATGAGTFTMQRVTDPDNADLLCLKVACTVADASIGATDDYCIFTAVEGYDVAWLNPGLASAGQISVRVKAKFPAAGTYAVFLQNSAQARSYLQTLTVPDGNENEYPLTWTLDTTGTWLLTNGVGLYLGIDLASGSNFQTTVGSWQAGNFKCTSGQTNFMAANTNIAYIKRVHLVPGPVALPYAPQDYQRELAKGKHYYRKSWAQGTAVGTATAVGERGFVACVNAGANFFPHEWNMRAAPTMGIFSPTSAAASTVRDYTAAADTAAGFGDIANSGATVQILPAIDQHQYAWHYTANARLT